MKAFKEPIEQVVVIGGGIMGSFLMKFLADHKINPLLIDANLPVTGSNPAFTRLGRGPNNEFSNRHYIELEAITPKPNVVICTTKHPFFNHSQNPEYFDLDDSLGVLGRAGYRNSSAVNFSIERPLGEDGQGASLINLNKAVSQIKKDVPEERMVQDPVVRVEECPDFVEIYCQSGKLIRAKTLVAAASGWNKQILPKNTTPQNNVEKKNFVFFFKIPKESLSEMEKFPTGIIKIEGGIEEFLKKHPDFVNKFTGHPRFDLGNPKNSEGIYFMVEKNEQGESFLKVGLAEPDPQSKMDIDEALKVSTLPKDNEVESKFVASLIMEFFPNLEALIPSLNNGPDQITVGPIIIIDPDFKNTQKHEESRIIDACKCNGGLAKNAPLEAHQLAQMTMEILLGKASIEHLSVSRLGARKPSRE
ncbi:MAG: hypothetical protein ACJAZX_001238 [Rickettsiales bacterium]|jgi:hypothetical protein